MASLSKHKSILMYGLSLALLLILLHWLEFRFVVLSYAIEIYIGAVAMLFTCLGIWLSVKLTNPKTIIVEKEIYRASDTFVLNKTKLLQVGISPREMEVLNLMSKGFSNAEIANRLFVSTNTVKTHCSKSFEKLAVSRRTQAIEKARIIGIIP